jgi:hypothetical protein
MVMAFLLIFLSLGAVLEGRGAAVNPAPAYFAGA